MMKSVVNNCATRTCSRGPWLLVTMVVKLLLVVVVQSLLLLPIVAAASNNNNPPPDNYMYVNPIQVRIKSFHIQVGPTNTDTQSTLSLADADVILGIVEDLVSFYARQHFGEMDDTEFKYVILSLVELSSRQQASRANNNNSNNNNSDRYTTTLQFSGGLAYFSGSSKVIPSLAEMQALVDLALNGEGEDLQQAIAEEFPFITRAEYSRGTYNDNNHDNDDNGGEQDNEQQETQNEEVPDTSTSSATSSSSSGNSDGGVASTELGNNDITTTINSASSSSSSGSFHSQIFEEEEEDIGEANDNDDAKDQFVIVVVSASVAVALFCFVVGMVALLHHKRRRAFWREHSPVRKHCHCSGNHHHHHHSKTIHLTNTMETDVDADAALEEDIEGAKKNKKRNRLSIRASASSAKQQSLHTRDSLRVDNIHDPQQQQQDDAQSDAGSSLVGRLLNTAAAAAINVLPASMAGGSDDLEKQPKEGDPEGSHDTSSCSHDSSSSNASIQSTKDAADDLTCTSEFEGNAVIQPNLVPVTDLDRFNDDELGAPLPPSRTASSRRDELPTLLSPNDSTETPFPTPTKDRPKSSYQEGFLAKYFHPISGSVLPFSSVSLSYFGSSTADSGNDHNNNNNKTKDMGALSPHTASTTRDIDIDIDARWSEVSSDLGNKTDDDFEADKAWDPDDTSVNSSENGKDAFSPMRASSELSYSDEILLLKATEQRHTYNLGKLRASPPPMEPSNQRNIVEIENTTSI